MSFLGAHRKTQEEARDVRESDGWRGGARYEGREGEGSESNEDGRKKMLRDRVRPRAEQEA